MPHNTDRIRREIQNMFAAARNNGLPNVDIRAGDLHDAVEFTAGSHPNQMPSCCNMLNEAMRVGDEVLYAPPKGRGANLEIRFCIPRRS